MGEFVSLEQAAVYNEVSKTSLQKLRYKDKKAGRSDRFKDDKVLLDFKKIKNAQEARGIEMSSKAPLMSRIKNMAAILFPLIFSSMERIEVVSNAMELRGFGKHKKRTWYSAKELERNDYLVLIVTAVFTVAALVITFHDGSRFYNPF